MVGNALATALYIGAQLGRGPRDGLMTGLARRTGRSLRLVRTLLEVTVVVLGVLLGWLAARASRFLHGDGEGDTVRTSDVLEKIGSVVSALVLAGLLTLALVQFASRGQLDADRWAPFTEWPIWSYLLVGLRGTAAARRLTAQIGPGSAGGERTRPMRRAERTASSGGADRPRAWGPRDGVRRHRRRARQCPR